VILFIVLVLVVGGLIHRMDHRRSFGPGGHWEWDDPWYHHPFHGYFLAPGWTDWLWLGLAGLTGLALSAGVVVAGLWWLRKEPGRTRTGLDREALLSLKAVYDRLDQRLRRIEDQVTAREYDWERRLNMGL
jgi:hypothetical protein